MSKIRSAIIKGFFIINGLVLGAGLLMFDKFGSELERFAIPTWFFYSYFIGTLLLTLLSFTLIIWILVAKKPIPKPVVRDDIKEELSSAEHHEDAKVIKNIVQSNPAPIREESKFDEKIRRLEEERQRLSQPLPVPLPQPKVVVEERVLPQKVVPMMTAQEIREFTLHEEEKKVEPKKEETDYFTYD